LPGLPISAYDDLPAFKIYLVDVGIPLFLADEAIRLMGIAMKK